MEIFTTLMESKLDHKMKNYHIYVFTKDGCPPCDRLHNHCESLTTDEKAELDFVPVKTQEGKRTALAEELEVELTPTLVVCSDYLVCDISDGDEYCDYKEIVVEKVVGANNIIHQLDSLLDAYTYSHEE